MEKIPEEPTLAQDEEVLGDLSDMGKGEGDGNA